MMFILQTYKRFKEMRLKKLGELFGIPAVNFSVVGFLKTDGNIQLLAEIEAVLKVVLIVATIIFTIVRTYTILKTKRDEVK